MSYVEVASPLSDDRQARNDGKKPCHFDEPDGIETGVRRKLIQAARRHCN
jgi:hypothetical protein